MAVVGGGTHGGRERRQEQRPVDQARMPLQPENQHRFENTLRRYASRRVSRQAPAATAATAQMMRTAAMAAVDIGMVGPCWAAFPNAAGVRPCRATPGRSSRTIPSIEIEARIGVRASRKARSVPMV